MKKPLSPSIHSGTMPAAEVIDRLTADALVYLAADKGRLARFFDITGLGIETLRQAADTPGFTAHLIDYLASDESRLAAFAVEKGYDPAQVEAIRLSLSPPIDDT